MIYSCVDAAARYIQKSLLVVARAQPSPKLLAIDDSNAYYVGRESSETETIPSRELRTTASRRRIKREPKATYARPRGTRRKFTCIG